MPNLEYRTVYFERPGRQNTHDTLRLAWNRAEEGDIRNVVVASSSGETGIKVSEKFKDYNTVIVTNVTGYKEPNNQRLTVKNREIIEVNGGKIIIAAHAFGTLGRAVNRKFGAIQVDEIIANVLRLFSPGVKVGCEISCMAADAGLIRTDEDTIAIGGSGGGADTAIIVRPSITQNFFDMRIKEIICKPH